MGPFNGRRRQRDDWGRRPRDPFQIWLQADPKRAAKLSALVTVSLILFWISVVIGILVLILVSI